MVRIGNATALVRRPAGRAHPSMPRRRPRGTLGAGSVCAI